MIGLPAPVPVTVTEQLVPDSVQVADEKETVPVPPDCDHEMVSPAIEPKFPATFAVHVVAAPKAKVDGMHETAVLVVAGLIVRLVVPELAVKLLLPANDALRAL